MPNTVNPFVCEISKDDLYKISQEERGPGKQMKSLCDRHYSGVAMIYDQGRHFSMILHTITKIILFYLCLIMRAYSTLCACSMNHFQLNINNSKTGKAISNKYHENFQQRYVPPCLMSSYVTGPIYSSHCVKLIVYLFINHCDVDYFRVSTTLLFLNNKKDACII